MHTNKLSFARSADNALCLLQASQEKNKTLPIHTHADVSRHRP